MREHKFTSKTKAVKTGKCVEVYPQIPVALVLKKKNRERLESWLHDKMHEWLEDEDYKHLIITDGFPGIHNYTDQELLEEYRQQKSIERS